MSLGGGDVVDIPMPGSADGTPSSAQAPMPPPPDFAAFEQSEQLEQSERNGDAAPPPPPPPAEPAQANANDVSTTYHRGNGRVLIGSATHCVNLGQVNTK